VPIGPVPTWQPLLANGTLHLQLAGGNLDLDPGSELAVAINEVRYGGGTPTGTARVAVLDDAGGGFVVLRDGAFTGRDQDQLLRTGLTATVAIGDVDGDALGEVLVGGVTAFTGNCDATPLFLLAIDDAVHGLADVAGRWLEYFYSGCDSPNDPRVRTVLVNTLDLDGDGRAEVQANQFLFDDFAATAPWTQVPAWTLPQRVVWQSGQGGWFDRGTASFVAGEFTGDDREDVAVYRQDAASVDVYSLAATATAVARVRQIPVGSTNSQQPRNHVLVPVDVDTDGTVLAYSEGEYSFLFTEPIVLAVLAAPPFAEGIGQNVDGCATAFGNTSSTTTEQERSVSFTAGASIGVNFDGGALTQSEFEIQVTATAAATRTSGTAYELSRTIVFTSAPREDTVVFTTVPIDRYTYTVLSSPDPTVIGQPVVVDLPRSPLTLQAERGFFNASLAPGGRPIDGAVLAHTIGVPRSYPTAADKEFTLLGGGLQAGPQSVGQGGGSTEVTLEVANAISEGGALEIGFELAAQTTVGGLLAGVQFGSSTESTWSVTSGEATTYTGIVGAIDAANFAANRYLFGLFTYVYRDPVSGREFQVLNYWVE
jgi:hypothetical protein